MNRLTKGLLLIEIVICFIPISYLLLLGIIMVPIQAWFLANAELESIQGPVYVFWTVAAGICGLVALVCVVRWLLFQTRANINPKIVLLLTCIGIVPVFQMALGADDLFGVLATVLPLLCSAHLVYLARAYLFGWIARPKRDRR